MGEERQHARFTLVTPGGSRSRGVAFGSSPGSLKALEGPHDLALRLERNRWNGTVEPRVILRAGCPTRPGELRVLGEEGGFWERVERAMAGGDSAAAGIRRGAHAVRDRRGDGFAGIAGDLLSSGRPVLVAVAHVARRRASLEAVLAGLAEDGLAVASWEAIAADPGLVGPFGHLLALDPPPGGEDDSLLARLPVDAVHLSWGEPELEFALAAYRFELDLRPALADAYRALRDGTDAEQALRGGGSYPRSPGHCAKLLTVLTELGLASFVEAADGGPSVRLSEVSARVDLERSALYRDCRERLVAVERALSTSSPRSARSAA
jgi:hypothetical protein